MSGPDYLALKRDLERIQQANLAEAAANDRMANTIVTHLNPPATEPEVLAFESQHFIRLPADYREFILTVANGGIGPVGGLERLGRTDGTDWMERPSYVGNLSIPFPYTDEWNVEPIDSSLPEEEQFKQQDWYWDVQHVNGAIPICDLGCGLRQLLIVTGPERNHIWFDDRADWNGLYPDVTSDGKRLSFFDWYRRWADNKLQTIHQSQFSSDN